MKLVRRLTSYHGRSLRLSWLVGWLVEWGLGRGGLRDGKFLVIFFRSTNFPRELKVEIKMKYKNSIYVNYLINSTNETSYFISNISFFTTINYGF